MALRCCSGRRCDSYYKDYLYSALNASKITEADIDTAVSRTLTHFIALGGTQHRMSPMQVIWDNSDSMYLLQAS